MAIWLWHRLDSRSTRLPSEGIKRNEGAAECEIRNRTSILTRALGQTSPSETLREVDHLEELDPFAIMPFLRP
jgi:hypothetical protein